MRVPIALLPLLLTGCLDITGPTSHEQVAWAKSPDGRTHAILIETNGGATTPFGYFVELHPADHKGQKPVRAASLVSATSQCARGVELQWLDANTLALRYVHAGRVELSSPVIVEGKAIRVVAQQEAADPATWCGETGR